jgi:hypothetical protein
MSLHDLARLSLNDARIVADENRERQVKALTERGRVKAGDVRQVGHLPQTRPTAPRSVSAKDTA